MQITKGSKVLFKFGQKTLVGTFVRIIKDGENTDFGETNKSGEDVFVVNTDSFILGSALVFENEIIKTEDEINEMTLEELLNVELSAERQRLVNEKYNDDENVTDEEYIEFLREKVKEEIFTLLQNIKIGTKTLTF